MMNKLHFSIVFQCVILFYKTLRNIFTLFSVGECQLVFRNHFRKVRLYTKTALVLIPFLEVFFLLSKKEHYLNARTFEMLDDSSEMFFYNESTKKISTQRVICVTYFCTLNPCKLYFFKKQQQHQESVLHQTWIKSRKKPNTVLLNVLSYCPTFG